MRQGLGPWLVGGAVLMLAFAGGMRSWIGTMEIERPEVIASAVISVFGTVAAALGGVVLWRAQDARESERRREDEMLRARRVKIALRAEVALSAETLRKSFEPEAAQTARAAYVERIQKADPGMRRMPAGVAMDEYFIFDGLRSDLAQLPSFAIRCVVRFYQNDRYMTELIAGFAEGRFDGYSVERQIAAIDQYFRLGAETTVSALTARAALDAALAGRTAFDEDDLSDWLDEDEATLVASLKDPAGAMWFRSRE